MLKALVCSFNTSLKIESVGQFRVICPRNSQILHISCTSSITLTIFGLFASKSLIFLVNIINFAAISSVLPNLISPPPMLWCCYRLISFRSVISFPYLRILNKRIKIFPYFVSILTQKFTNTHGLNKLLGYSI